MFGLCDCHQSSIYSLIKADKKIAAIRVLRNCTGLTIHESKGIIDFATDYHKSTKTARQDKELITFTEDMIFQDDFCRIHSPNCEDCRYTKFGGNRCEQDVTDIYYQLYNALTPDEKENVNTWIYGNMLFDSSAAIKQAIDEHSDVKKHLADLGITKPKCMK